MFKKILDMFKQTTIYCRTINNRSMLIDYLPDCISQAIEYFSDDHLDLYKLHKQYFDIIEKESNQIKKAIESIWERHPRGPRYKSIYICFPNKRSRWTDICMKIETVKRFIDGKLAIDRITIRKYYRPERFASHLIYLNEPSEEWFKEQLESLD